MKTEKWIRIAEMRIQKMLPCDPDSHYADLINDDKDLIKFLKSIKSDYVKKADIIKWIDIEMSPNKNRMSEITAWLNNLEG